MDQAHITNQPLVERPYWYEDTEARYCYHDIYACLGWPSEVSDKDMGLPGYAAIVGVVRPPGLDRDTHYDAKDAKFRLLAEAEDRDVPTLLTKCLEMREKYGYGLNSNLLNVWYGDPERYYTTLALFNEELGERKALMLTPPNDFYGPKIFDIYVRSFQSTVLQGKQRFYYAGGDILKHRLKEFYRDDPSALAIGGLVHTLLGHCIWMSDGPQGSGCFNVEDGL